MYSNNDFRSYQELYHAEEKKKAKWPWLPGGKNTPEYNHWYYMTHPEKWGITKAGQQAVDAVKKGVDDFTNWTETDLDNKAVDALSRGYNKAKTAVTNTNAYKNAKNVASDVRRSTEAMQRRDDANRTAAEKKKAYENAMNSYNSRIDAAKSIRSVANNPNASYAAQQAAASGYKKATNSTNVRRMAATKLAADQLKKEYEEAERRAGQESVNAKGYAARARNTAKSAVTNTVDMYKNRIGYAANDLERRIREGVRNNNTQVDDHLVRAIDRLTDKDQKDITKRLKGAGREAVGAGREAVSDIKKALGKAVDNVGNTVSKVKNAAEAYDAYRDYEKLRNTKDADRRELAAAKSRFERESKDEGGKIGVRAVDARNNLINTAKVAKANTQNMVGAAKNNSIIAAQRASKSVKDIYDHAMKELGDIRDKYGQNSPQYLEALKDIKQDAIQAVKDTGSQIRTAFQNAPGTVMDVMSSGAEWISNTFDNLISREEQILMSPEAEERQRQQQNTKLSGRYTDFDYENDEAERRRNESQKKKVSNTQTNQNEPFRKKLMQDTDTYVGPLDEAKERKKKRVI